MKVTVKLFAVAQQLAGQDAVDVELPDGATVADLRKRLSEQCAPLSGILRVVTFAIGTEYAGDNTVIPPAAEVACIPPVSGG